MPTTATRPRQLVAALFVLLPILVLGCNALFGVSDLEHHAPDPSSSSAGGTGGSGGGNEGGAGASTGGGGVAGAGGAQPNYALRFDGIDDLVVVPSPVTTDFTVELWFRTTAANPNANNFIQSAALFYADIPGCATDYGMGVIDEGCAFGISLLNGTGCSHPTYTSMAVVTTGEWIHAAGWRNAASGEVGVYINGVADGATATSVTAAIDSLTAHIGGIPAMSGRFFDGDIDEVRVWGFVRSATEVGATMNTPLVGDEPGLLGYWRFDEGDGVVAKDDSGNANDGALGIGFGSAPTWILSDAPVAPR